MDMAPTTMAMDMADLDIIPITAATRVRTPTIRPTRITVVDSAAFRSLEDSTPQEVAQWLEVRSPAGRVVREAVVLKEASQVPGVH